MAGTARSRRSSRYGVHPSVALTQQWLAALEVKSGRSIEAWSRLLAREAPKDEAGRAGWLKKEHGLGTNQAGFIAAWSFGKGRENADPGLYVQTAERYVNEMFAGPKAGLQPLYEEVLELCLSLGKDVKACPCQTIVPIYRVHVIAQIKPSTRTRLDLGFALGPTKASGRLIDTGGFAKKDRITHRIPIESRAALDAEVKRWLRTAYEMDANEKRASA